MNLQEGELNQRAYRRLKEEIDQTYSPGQYIAIVHGKVVADAPTFRELISKLERIEKNPDHRLVVQAGAEYPKTVVKLTHV